MAIHITKAWVVAAVVLGSWAAATLCPPGIQYWSNESEICINCSRCDSVTKQVVIRPCQAHADTVCGPISHLNVDWSWLKSANKHHPKHGDTEHQSFTAEKKHHKKIHKDRAILSDEDIEKTRTYHSELDDEVESFPLISHHSGHKNRKQPKEMFDFMDRQSQRHASLHHFEDESPDSQGLRKSHKHSTSPSPPLKSAEDIEKEWRTWLAQSRDRLQHRKDDLLKNLHKESPYNEKHRSNHKLNHPSANAFDDLDGEVLHTSINHEDHSDRHFSPLDLEIFDRLLNHEQFKHEEQLDKSKHENLLDMMEADDRKRGNDLAYPMDSFDFKSAIPTHRLFLGEPSTVSEIMDQDISDDDAEDDEDERWSVVAVPFTTAERFVWDWQAVALTSAVAACLLFFVVVSVYSLLHARQWRSFKSSFENDVEDLSAKVGLMSGSCGSVGSSAAEGVNTNHYLEDLLGNKKKSSNIYTQKRPSS